jgi:hypothetical protein
VQFQKLPVDLRHVALHFGDGLRGANSGNHVFALGVDQVLAVDQVFAGAGIAREADAGARVVAHVAENHGADIHRRTVGLGPGDPELLAVVDRPLAVPGAEYGLDRQFELFVGIFRKGLAGVGLDDPGELVGQFREMFGLEVDVLRNAHLLLHRRHGVVEMLVLDAEGDLAVELDETTVGVVAETRVVRQLDQALQGGLVQPQVEDGIHHARHGHRRTGADRYEQRIFGAAESLAGLGFEILHVLQDLLPGALGQFIVLQVGKASVRGNREARRNIQADLRHLAQVGALAAQQHLVFAVAILECKHPFLLHCRLPHSAEVIKFPPCTNIAILWSSRE